MKSNNRIETQTNKIKKKNLDYLDERVKEHIWTNHCERESSELEREKRSCRGERKQCKPTSARKDDRSRFGKEASPDGADRTFPNGHHPNIIQGLNRKHNGRHRPL